MDNNTIVYFGNWSKIICVFPNIIIASHVTFKLHFESDWFYRIKGSWVTRLNLSQSFVHNLEDNKNIICLRYHYHQHHIQIFKYIHYMFNLIKHMLPFLDQEFRYFHYPFTCIRLNNIHLFSNVIASLKSDS